MQIGDIVIVSFPHTDLITFKARPAVVVTEIKDNYNDVIVSLITSIVPATLSSFQIMLQQDLVNNLKTPSVIKVVRLATINQNKILAIIGRLNEPQL